MPVSTPFNVLGGGAGPATSVGPAPSGYGWFADGTAAAPSISFVNDTDTGFYLNGANTLGYAAGGSLALRFGRAAGGIGNRAFIAGVSNAGVVNLFDSGEIYLEAGTAGGTNQNITLAPSGTGRVAVSKASADNIMARFTNSGANGARIDLEGSNASIAKIFAVGTGFALGGKEFSIYDITNGASRLLITDGGNSLFGTTTDSANGRIQIADHAGVTGGLGIGTGISLYSVTSGGTTLATAAAFQSFGSANNRAEIKKILYGATTDAATAVELTTDGAAGSGTANRIVVPTNTALSVVLNICVKQTGSANAKQMLRQFVISNNAGTTAIQGTVVTLGTDSGSAGLTTVSCTVTANDTDDAIKIDVNGVAATNLRYSAYVISTEVLYA